MAVTLPAFHEKATFLQRAQHVPSVEVPPNGRKSFVDGYRVVYAWLQSPLWMDVTQRDDDITFRNMNPLTIDE
ncbi:MAG: hypothetical protein SFX73_08560 [Kofleriaceae bacterium]|nr:hypothetical protein [Kofleriaceae bacterium]